MSKIDDTQEFCIGQSGNNPGDKHYHECTDVSGGIRFEFCGGCYNKVLPMRFNKKGETTCNNYHPDYLQNLATSLGYNTYVVNVKRAANGCRLVWLDGDGNWQAGSNYDLLYDLELPFDVTFSGSIGKV